jgi:Family of unknown function (DUF5662)
MTELNQAELATNAQTWDHIEVVMKLLGSAQIELMRRQFTHDRSKLGNPEVSTFVEFTPKLKGSTFGSEEYKGFLTAMKPALDHHYAHNRHHPEFFKDKPQSDPENIENAIVMVEHLWKVIHSEASLLPDDGYGVDFVVNALKQRRAENLAPINGMNLFDLLEMFIDWCAACQRHVDGDIEKSIQIGKDRFLMSPQLVQIFRNTVGWVNDEFAGMATQADLAPQTSSEVITGLGSGNLKKTGETP